MLQSNNKGLKNPPISGFIFDSEMSDNERYYPDFKILHVMLLALTVLIRRDCNNFKLSQSDNEK